ncbi:hypothetical protein AMECASPLE_029652, partial [Ameca splendens]
DNIPVRTGNNANKCGSLKFWLIRLKINLALEKEGYKMVEWGDINVEMTKLADVAAHVSGEVDTIYILNHYTAGVILFGDRTELPRKSLHKYINTKASTVFLMDPAQLSSELEDSKNASKRIQE